LNLAFSVDTTTLLAVFVVSLLVLMLLVMRKYHKRIKTKEATVAQSSVTEKEAPTIAN